MKIILVNGPPRSGKDTAAAAIRELLRPNFFHFAFEFERMSRPIKEAFAGMIGPELCGIDKEYNVLPFEANKEEPILQLGVSYRQWQMDFSEKFMKPLYGENIFARLFVSRVKDLDLQYPNSGKEPVIVVPDCGFQIEFESVLEAFGGDNVALLKIMRQGCDFSKDSREYIEARKMHGFIPVSGYRCAYFPLINSDKSMYERDVQRVVSYFLKGE